MPRLRQSSPRADGPAGGSPREVASRVVRAGEVRRQRQGRRRGQWDALRTLWDCSSLDRVRTCRRVSRGKPVVLNLQDGRASYSGLATCGSVWACPCCSSRINATRADELRQAVEGWHAQGGTVALLTLTMRHRRGVSLGTYWEALSPALAASVGGRYSRARKAKQAAGLFGYVITREATYGANGWHLHAHALLFLNAPTTEALDELGSAFYAAWATRLEREGLAAPDLRHGIDLRVLELSEGRAHAAAYLAKGTYEATRAAGELSGGAGKTARRGNRTPWDVLADLTACRRPRDIALWREWEQASHHRRALTWSVGLRDRLALGQERDDDALAVEDVEGGAAAETLLLLTPDEWRAVRHRRHGPTELLDAAEGGGPPVSARRACVQLLNRWGVARPGPGPPVATTAAASVRSAPALAAV